MSYDNVYTLYAKTGLLALQELDFKSIGNLPVFPSFAKKMSDIADADLTELLADSLPLYLHNLLRVPSFPRDLEIMEYLAKFDEEIEDKREHPWIVLFMASADVDQAIDMEEVAQLDNPAIQAGLSITRGTWESMSQGFYKVIVDWLQSNRIEIQNWQSDYLMKT